MYISLYAHACTCIYEDGVGLMGRAWIRVRRFGVG